MQYVNVHGMIFQRKVNRDFFLASCSVGGPDVSLAFLAAIGCSLAITAALDRRVWLATQDALRNLACLYTAACRWSLWTSTCSLACVSSSVSVDTPCYSMTLTGTQHISWHWHQFCDIRCTLRPESLGSDLLRLDVEVCLVVGQLIIQQTMRQVIRITCRKCYCIKHDDNYTKLKLLHGAVLATLWNMQKMLIIILV